MDYPDTTNMSVYAAWAQERIWLLLRDIENMSPEQKREFKDLLGLGQITS